MSKTTKKVKVSKVRATEVKKIVKAEKITLTLKQALSIEAMITKFGKTNKTLSNKIANIMA